MSHNNSGSRGTNSLLLALALTLPAAACGEESDRTPEARTCDEVLSLPDRDETGELKSAVLRRQLEDWRKVWEHAKDAEPIREPVREIVDDLARAVDGDGSTFFRGNLEVELAANDLVLACIDLPQSATTTEP